MTSRFCIALLALATLVTESQAGPFARRSVARHREMTSVQTTPAGTAYYHSESTSVRGPALATGTALDEVNMARARRGLPPFVEDPALTAGAQAVASYRASRLIRDHTGNDFGFLPPGAHAAAAGCGALEPSWGWGTCCTYEQRTYAGAGWAWGHDGRRYMHLFVR